MLMAYDGYVWLPLRCIYMYLGVDRRDRQATRADKFWKSVWLRQMLSFNRGLTKPIDRDKNYSVIKFNHGTPMNNPKENT